MKAFLIGAGIGVAICLVASGLWFLAPLCTLFFMDWSGDGDGRQAPTSLDNR